MVSPVTGLKGREAALQIRMARRRPAEARPGGPEASGLSAVDQSAPGKFLVSFMENMTCKSVSSYGPIPCFCGRRGSSRQMDASGCPVLNLRQDGEDGGGGETDALEPASRWDWTRESPGSFGGNGFLNI